jgi:hydrogenase maturation protease
VKPVVILGIGNVLLRDEGFGVRVVEALGDLALPPEVEAVDGGTAGADLLEAIAHRRKVIVVDVVKADAPAGAILRFGAEDLGRTPSGAMSLHELGFAQALEMANLLDCAPEDVVIFGVVPGEVCFGLELSEAVAAAMPAVIQAVIGEAGKSLPRPELISPAIPS